MQKYAVKDVQYTPIYLDPWNYKDLTLEIHVLPGALDIYYTQLSFALHYFVYPISLTKDLA